MTGGSFAAAGDAGIAPAWEEGYLRASVVRDPCFERAKTGEYIRPIMLLQAQPRRQGRKTLTVDVLRKSLLEDFHVPQEEGAIDDEVWDNQAG